jgi:hypothetical protein
VLPPGVTLSIPNVLGEVTPAGLLLPDSELVYSPSAANFDIDAFVQEAGGYLASYQEWHKSTGMKTGAEIARRRSGIDQSALLLALLGSIAMGVWPATRQEQIDYPMGWPCNRKGLYNRWFGRSIKFPPATMLPRRAAVRIAFRWVKARLARCERRHSAAILLHQLYTSSASWT